MGKSHTHLNEPTMVMLQQALSESGIKASRMDRYLRVNLNHNKESMAELRSIFDAMKLIGLIQNYREFVSCFWVFPPKQT